MLGFAPDRYNRAPVPLTDDEIRWLHGDESCRPASIQHVGPQVPEDLIDGAKVRDEDLPLARLGPGGSFNRDIRPAALCEPGTRDAKDGRRRGGVSFWIFTIAIVGLIAALAGIVVMAVRP